MPKGSKGWKFIRKVGQEEVAKALVQGISVVYDDTNVRFEHREEFRDVARKAGARAIVVYVNTPMELIKQRETANRITGERHEVEPENFKTVFGQLQPPTYEENVLEFRPDMNLEGWIKNLA